MVGVVVAVVVAVVLCGLYGWELFVAHPRTEEALRRLDDDQLERLWRAPLDGRQLGWVAAERERRRPT